MNEKMDRKQIIIGNAKELEKKEDLIKNKRASGRHRDLADIESFEES